MDGTVDPPRLVDGAATVLSLAKANNVARVLTTANAAAMLRQVQEQRPKQLGAVDVVVVKNMVEVMRAVWGL